MAILRALLVISKLLSFLTQISCTTDTIAQSQSLHDGSTLISKDGNFELGFFSPGSSTNRYVGIWYKNIPVKTIVWVANRDNPAKDNSSKLMISKEGNLALLSQGQTLLWSTNTTTETSLSPIVQLLDTGNLVVRDGSSDNNSEENFLWQSFDHPSDKMLPGMKLGWNLKTGLNRRFTSWKSWDDPSTGDFTWGIVPTCNPEMVMWKGLVESYRSGPWNGIRFSGSPTMRENPVYDYNFVNNSNELYFTYNLKNKSVISIIVMNQTLYLRQRFTWIPENKTWRIYHSIPRDNCDAYNLCGPNGICVDGQSPICQCLEGFKPKSSQNWEAMDWSQGCVRREAWSCGTKGKDGFRRFTGLKLPDTTQSWVNESMTLEDCRARCLGNCSCAAYSNLDVRGEGSGCAIWFGDLVNLRIIESGQDIYIRMAVPVIVTNGVVKHGHKKFALAIAIPFASVLVLLLAIFYIYKTKRKYMEQTDKTSATEKKHEEGQEDLELPFFDLATIINATSDFSIDNKLGEGGFGPVYKGILGDGQEVAVKRLARASQQGLQEFKNEVILCAKLQHRNLVKVIGCCIEEDEKMLVYEYLPNKSLDYFLFDSAQKKHLDWPKRLHIINGIARGLLYLHHDSRLRIIHRDLKASNILLDKEMNPKISDFGLARMCGGDQIEGNTRRIVGTYGYMSPEYAIDGLFSIKSDIFSFGILLLEIVSGMKNKGMFSFPSQSYNLIGHAWRLWKENVLVKLTDSCLGDTLNLYEACRCIHIGLLCVQQQPDDRPNMASVVVMLNSESTLPQPKEPSFLIEKVTMERESSYLTQASSTNEVTMSVLEAR